MRKVLPLRYLRQKEISQSTGLGDRNVEKTDWPACQENYTLTSSI